MIGFFCLLNFLDPNKEEPTKWVTWLRPQITWQSQ